MPAPKTKGRYMKKKIMDILIALTILLAMSGSAYAQNRIVGISAAPDSCVTSVVLAGVAGALGLARKFLR
jgi:hypothetical protein